jgi:hypothetical protein
VGEEEDPDLSQNLLEETQHPVNDEYASNNKQRNTLSQEVDFDNVDDDINSIAVNKKSQRLSIIKEGGSISPSSIFVPSVADNSVQSNVASGGHGSPKSCNNSASSLCCAAMEFCVNVGKELQSIALTVICINCNYTAHLNCVDQLCLQVPAEDGGMHQLNVTTGRIIPLTCKPIVTLQLLR